MAAEKLLMSKTAIERGWWSASGIKALMASPGRHGYRIYTLLALELAVRMFTGGTMPLSAPNATLKDIADAA